MGPISLSTLTVLAVLSTPPEESPPAAPAAADGLWTAHVQPILNRHCVKCHGSTKTKGGLDLRVPASILAGGERGAAVVPGKPAESLLYRFVQPDADPDMPPGKAQLDEEEIATLETWIRKLAAPSAGEEEPAASAAKTPTAAPTFTPPPGLSPELVIDLLIEEDWRDRGVTSSPRCDDSAFVRRVYIDVVGRIPTLAERRRFLESTRSDKRARLVDELLESPEYARHLRELFDPILMGRAGERQDRFRRESGWYEFLERAFAENRPWNEIVRDIVVARPERREDRGAVAFLRARRDKHQEIAEAVAPAVFGIQIQCAQCHDHPVAPEIEQRHYWGLVSFFNRSKNIDTRKGPRVAESAIGGFIDFSDLEGKSHPAELVFFMSDAIPEHRPKDGDKEADSAEKYVVPPPAKDVRPESEPVPIFSRRRLLYDEVILENDLFPKALVNRLWAHFFGRGLVHPVDKIDSAHPPSHPELLEWLAADFRSNGYDLKRLIRSLLRTRAYQLDSRPMTEDVARQPEAFAFGLEKPLPAESLLRSTLVATGHFESSEPEGLDLDELRLRFSSVFPELFPEEYSATLNQALYLTNNAAIAKVLEPREGNTTSRLLEIETTRDRVERAFEAVLGRAPESDEVERATAYLEARTDRPEAALEQLIWTLLASAEFRFNH